MLQEINKTFQENIIEYDNKVKNLYSDQNRIEREILSLRKDVFEGQLSRKAIGNRALACINALTELKQLRRNALVEFQEHKRNMINHYANLSHTRFLLNKDVFNFHNTLIEKFDDFYNGIEKITNLMEGHLLDILKIVSKSVDERTKSQYEEAIDRTNSLKK